MAGELVLDECHSKYEYAIGECYVPGQYANKVDNSRVYTRKTFILTHHIPYTHA